MNLPNLITLSRVPMLFIIAWLSYMPQKGMASIVFVAFVLAAFTDWLDGYIARRFHMVSKFGKLMDALTDKIMMMGLLILLLDLNCLKGWWGITAILLILAREFWITGLRALAASEGVVLAAEKAGKIKTTFQFISIGAFFASIALFRDFNFALDSTVYQLFHGGAVLSFAIATVLTLSSGFGYIRNHWSLMLAK